MADFYFTGEPITTDDYVRLLLRHLQATSPCLEVQYDREEGTLCLT